MPHAFARRARAAAPKPAAAARKPAARPSAGLPAYLKSGVNVVRPDAPAEQEAESVARAVAGGGNAWGAGRAGGNPLARAPQLPAKPEEKKPEAPVKKAAKVEPEKKPDAKKPDAPVKRASQAPDPLSKKDDEPAAPIKRAEKAPGAEGIEDKMKMPVARLAREDAAPAVESAPPEEEPVARKARGEGEGEAGAAAEAQTPAIALAAAAASPGRPLTPTMRALLEQRLGADLAHVRLHDDRAAQEAADALEARAYTQGAEIYLGRGESEGDVELVAHEVTHVLQNDGGAAAAEAPVAGAAAPIAREPKTGDAAVPPPSKAEMEKAGGNHPGVPKGKIKPSEGTWENGIFKAPGIGSLDPGAKRITLDTVQVPGFKFALPEVSGTKNIKVAKGARATEQGKHWAGAAGAGGALPEKIKGKLGSAPGKSVVVKDRESYFGRAPAKEKRDGTLVGTPEEIAAAMVVPGWTADGKPMRFQIDHKLDIQFGGADAIGNLWLVNASKNMGAGPLIQGDMRVRIAGLLIGASRADPAATVPDAKAVMPPKPKGDAKGGAPAPAGDGGAAPETGYDIEIAALSGDGKGGIESYQLDDIIKQARPVEPVQAMPPAEAEKLFSKDPSEYVLLLKGHGGRSVRLKMKDGAPESTKSIFLGPGVQVDAVSIPEGMGGTIDVTLFPNSETVDEKKDKITILPRPELGFGGAVDSASLKAKKMEARGFSTIAFDELAIGEAGLEGQGVLTPSLDLLGGVPIDVTVQGGKAAASITLGAGELKLPKPFSIDEASVTLGYRENKVFAEGNVAFAIEKFGKGDVKVSVDSKGAFAAEGKFDVDPKLVSSCTIKAWYREGSFGGEGDAKIDGKKLKGVKEASLHILFDKDKFEASGALKPDLPSVTEAGVSVKYDRAKDLLTVGGKVTLGAMPGISGGSLDVTATQKDEGWSLAGTGSLTPKIPGIESSIGIVYDDGLFTADATVKFAKGKLSGNAHLVVSNAEIVDGKPGKEKSDKISFWGEGSAGLQITPWLKGTASIVFKPDGTFDVSGEIATDKAIELLKPAKKFDKKLEKSVKITLAGIPRAGLYARIGGGVELGASAGPVVLDQVSVKVDFSNSSGDLSVTGVKGKARLSIPAEASAKIFLKIALGAEVLIAYAEGSLTGSITAAIKGGLFQDIAVDWTPQAGLSISTEAKAVFKPVVTLALTGGLEVGLDLVLKNVTLYEESWELGSFSFGSDMEFGIQADASYKETEGFKLGEIKPILPDLDIGAIGKRAIDAVL